ncbi:MAG: hypothetical protein KJ799_12875 [Bacteroidetes bacterium]|nr:hypothetical protein [Bacteroidota bacterium]MBU1679345.1 hypothetical protein [Bacteroidota bacterium]MBU2507597.1 hypothetical protein [Bacteroidota bacterium]
MKTAKYLLLLLLALVFIGCGDTEDTEDAKRTYGDRNLSRDVDRDLKEYNIEKKKELAANRTPCDTIAVQEFILATYPEGTSLVEFDRTYTYNIPKPAVLYFIDRDRTQYIFTAIAKSKEGERPIERKNIIGYESSFINLDSTRLGTAFFYLVLLECSDNNFNVVWESEVPIHGGFNSMKMKTWKNKNMSYIELNFEAGIISGHRNYNYFFVDGIRNKPHLMETYLGIAHKRILINENDDKFPDYLEYRFIDDSVRIKLIDSVKFYWDTQRELYVTKRNKKWFRKF